MTVSAKVLGLIVVVVVASLVSAVVYVQLMTASNGGSNSRVESLELVNAHVWGNQSGWFEAACVVVNTGEKDAVLRKVTVRSVESPWSNIYYWETDMGPPSDELKQTSDELSGNSFDIAVDGVNRTFLQASDGLALRSGGVIVLYVKDPGNLTLAEADVNPRATISVYSENRLYYKEVQIDVTYITQAGLFLTKESVTWPTNSTIIVVIRNTGTGNGKVTGVYVGTSPSNLVSATVASPILPASIGAGSTMTITLTYSWTTNTRYYFKFATDTPATLEFSEGSP